MRKFTVAEIKAELPGLGPGWNWNWQSEESPGVTVPLQVTCLKGHPYSNSLTGLRIVKHCPTCIKELPPGRRPAGTGSQGHTDEEIRAELETTAWEWSGRQFPGVLKKIEVTCRKAGHPAQKTMTQIRKKVRCFPCSQIERHAKIADLASARGGRVIEGPEHYKNNQTRFTFECFECNKPFTRRVEDLNHKNSWCDHGRLNIAETAAFMIAEALFQAPFERRKSMPGLVGLGGGLLQFDMFNQVLSLIIEYDGAQHEEECTKFEKSTLAQRRAHDRIKDAYCLDHNIDLIRIHHTVRIPKMEADLRKQAAKLSIPIPPGGPIDLKAMNLWAGEWERLQVLARDRGFEVRLRDPNGLYEGWDTKVFFDCIQCGEVLKGAASDTRRISCTHYAQGKRNESYRKLEAFIQTKGGTLLTCREEYQNQSTKIRVICGICKEERVRWALSILGEGWFCPCDKTKASRRFQSSIGQTSQP